jgi:co-chaperonin GroES (HSP10)
MKPTLQTFRPMAGKIFVSDLESGMTKTAGGIIITDDNMKQQGIRPRWGRVVKVADDITEVSTGEWVLVEHGRWTMGMEWIDADNDQMIKVWMVEPKSMLLATDEDPRPAQFKLI